MIDMIRSNYTAKVIMLTILALFNSEFPVLYQHYE